MPSVANPRRHLADRIVPRIALVVLPAAWILLAATMPTATARDLTIDVTCASGNAVVRVWIESSSGGSAFAEPSGPAYAAPQRFVARQHFPGAYQVRAGCGGVHDQWGITALSNYDDQMYRRLVCDDVDVIDPGRVRCRDLTT